MEIDISAWPEKPYRWMINDLRAGIKAEMNYLVALGLFCYTEFMGREVLKFRKPNNENINTNKYNKLAFNLFLGEYIGYQDLLSKYESYLYNWFRNGVFHEYHIKADHSGIFKRFEAESELKFKKQGIDTSVGLIVKSREQGLNEKALTAGFLIMEVYLNDFTKGIQKFLVESKRISGKMDKVMDNMC